MKYPISNPAPTSFRQPRIKSTRWFRRFPFKAATVGNWITVLYASATLLFSWIAFRQANVNTRDATLEQQRNDTASEKRNAWMQHQLTAQYKAQLSALNANKSQTDAVTGQLKTQKQSLEYALLNSQPRLDISEFNRVDTQKNLESVSMTFINSGGRVCRVRYIEFSVVNSTRNYAQFFPSTVAGQEVDYRNNMVRGGFALPLAVAKDPNTMFYYRLTATDELTNKEFSADRYFKNPSSAGGPLSLNTYLPEEFRIMDRFLRLMHNKKQKEDLEHANHPSVINRDPLDLYLVTVADHTTTPCSAGPAIGCFTASVNARVGDTVAVQLYFHNCSTTTLHKVAAGLSPEITQAEKSHSFHGVIAEKHGLLRDSATIVTADSTILAFIPHSMRYYKNQSHIGLGIICEPCVFSSRGINLGDIRPDWRGQGSLVLLYKVYTKKDYPVR